MQEGRLMRFPDIHRTKSSSCTAATSGWHRVREATPSALPPHPGRELFPKFSPDGKWIAFTGQYDGNFNVYVMPAEGGQPKQLTFYQGAAAPLSDRMGIHNEVVTWTPDSKRIVFLSRRDASNGWTKRPFSVSIDGGLPEPLPVDQGGLTSFSPDGTKIAYNRSSATSAPGSATPAAWPRPSRSTISRTIPSEDMPHTDWTDTFPMWHGNTIYFTSDRGPEHRLNLYSYDSSSKQVEQLTHFTDFDVMWPSLGPDAIVFENGGYLYTFDLQSKQPKKLTIYLPGDRDQAMKHWVNVSKNITDFDISPEGKRAVFGARGDVFTVPAKEGSIRNLTRTPGIREKRWRGRPTAAGSPTSPTAPAKTKSTSRRRTAWARNSRSPADTRVSSMPRRGRPTARNLLGPTRTALVVCRHQREEAGRGRSREIWRDSELLLVARQQVAGLRQECREQRFLRRLSLFAGGHENHARRPPA